MLGWLALQQVLLPMRAFLSHCDDARTPVPPRFRAALYDAKSQLEIVQVAAPAAVWQHLESLVRCATRLTGMRQSWAKVLQYLALLRCALERFRGLWRACSQSLSAVG